MSTKRTWNYELISALAAVFIGACALITSVIQTQVMLKQQDASVWPVVHWGYKANINNVNRTGNFELYAENKGVGPAIIEQIRFVYDQKSYPEDSLINIVFHKILKVRDLTADIDRATLEGSIIAPNERVSILKVGINEQGDEITQYFLTQVQENQLDIKICYKNIYEKAWQVTRQVQVYKICHCP